MVDSRNEYRRLFQAHFFAAYSNASSAKFFLSAPSATALDEFALCCCVARFLARALTVSISGGMSVRKSRINMIGEAIKSESLSRQLVLRLLGSKLL